MSQRTLCVILCCLSHLNSSERMGAAYRTCFLSTCKPTRNLWTTMLYVEKTDVPVICIPKQLNEAFLTNTKEWCVGRHTWSILQGYYPKIASSCSYSLADTWQGSCCLMRKQLIHHSKVAKLTMSTHGCSTANPYILW